jgi:hypothetical protein
MISELFPHTNRRRTQRFLANGFQIQSYHTYNTAISMDYMCRFKFVSERSRKIKQCYYLTWILFRSVAIRGSRRSPPELACQRALLSPR